MVMPTAEAASPRETPSLRRQRERRRLSLVLNPPGVDGQGYIPSQQVQQLGRSPASRDPL